MATQRDTPSTVPPQVRDAVELTKLLDQSTTAASDIRLKTELDALIFEIRLHEQGPIRYEVTVSCFQDELDQVPRVIVYDRVADERIYEVNN